MADYSDYKECTDCVHYELCLHQEKFLIEHNRKDLIRRYGFGLCEPEICCNFRDRSRFIELSDVGNYDTVTTIDEAIDHCYQIATSTDETVCAECKAEHMRLCGWLGDLKRRIAAEQALKEREENAN